MFRTDELKEKNGIVNIQSSDITEQKAPRIIEELMDLIGKYKAKRNIWELKLKAYNNPRKPELYVIIARLAILDMMIIDLERVIRLLTEKTE